MLQFSACTQLLQVITLFHVTLLPLNFTFLMCYDTLATANIQLLWCRATALCYWYCCHYPNSTVLIYSLVLAHACIIRVWLNDHNSFGYTCRSVEYRQSGGQLGNTSTTRATDHWCYRSPATVSSASVAPCHSSRSARHVAAAFLSRHRIIVFRSAKPICTTGYIFKFVIFNFLPVGCFLHR